MTSSKNHKRFQDKVVLVTGGTSGIGAKTALKFADEGAKIVLAGRREKEGLEVVNKIKELGGEAIFVKTNVADEEQVKTLVNQTVEKFGKLDVAFNNAGIEGTTGFTTDQTVENYRNSFDINVLGTLLSMKHEIPAMVDNGGGAIINNASIAGIIGMAGAGVYIGTKHAVLGITKSTALETAEQNIRVNAVSPGPIDTDMFDRFTGGNDEAKKHLTSLVPMKRLGKSEEIANVVLFLASDGASYVTGQHLIADGGFTA